MTEIRDTDDREMSREDDRKFREIYDDSKNHVYRFIISLVHDPTVAKDLTAEVFFTLWKKKELLTEYRNIRSLLFKISRDVSVDYLRKLASNRSKKQEFFRYYLDLKHSAEELEIREAQLSSLEQAIDQLPDRCREVVRMKFVTGKSLKEISAELRISVNTVQNHLAKGKMLIRKWMDDRNT